MSTNYNEDRYSNYKCDDDSDYNEDRHVHEYEGSTRFAERCDDKHNHRFAGVTGEPIKYGKSHVHKLATNTDYVDHHHKICVTTGPAIYVGNGKHVHLIEAPTEKEKNYDC